MLKAIFLRPLILPSWNIPRTNLKQRDLLLIIARRTKFNGKETFFSPPPPPSFFLSFFFVKRSDRRTSSGKARKRHAYVSQRTSAERGRATVSKIISRPLLFRRHFPAEAIDLDQKRYANRGRGETIGFSEYLG